MNKESFVRISSFIVFSILINIILFASLPHLVRDTQISNDLESIVPVQFITIDNEPPPKENKEKVRPPKKEKIFKVSASAIMNNNVPRHMQDVSMDLPEMNFEINPKIAEGMPVAMPDMKNFSFDPGEVDQLPVKICNIKPFYPHGARRMGITGLVKVSFIVDEYGNVGRIKIIESTPEGIFEQSVIEAVSSWRFMPGKVQDKAVPILLVQTISFKLRE